MKKSFFGVVIGLLVIQAVLLIFLRGSPDLKLERSYTRTPTITPLPLPPTAVPPTRIPTLAPATMVAPPTLPVIQSSPTNQSSTTGQPTVQAATPKP